MKTKGRVVDETMVLTDLMRSLTIKDFVMPDPDAFQALFASAFPDGKMTRLSYKAFLDAHSPKNKK